MQKGRRRPSKLVLYLLGSPVYGLGVHRHFISIDRIVREVFEKQGCTIMLHRSFVNDYKKLSWNCTDGQVRKRTWGDLQILGQGRLARWRAESKWDADHATTFFFLRYSSCAGPSSSTSHRRKSAPYLLFLFLYLFLPKKSIPSCTYI